MGSAENCPKGGDATSTYKNITTEGRVRVFSTGSELPPECPIKHLDDALVRDDLADHSEIPVFGSQHLKDAAAPVNESDPGTSMSNSEHPPALTLDLQRMRLLGLGTIDPELFLFGWRLLWAVVGTCH